MKTVMGEEQITCAPAFLPVCDCHLDVMLLLNLIYLYVFISKKIIFEVSFSLRTATTLP